MPKGTKVHDCVDSVKARGKKGVNPYAVCQASTGQSFATGKKKRKSDGRKIGSPKESLEARLHRVLLTGGALAETANIADFVHRCLSNYLAERGKTPSLTVLQDVAHALLDDLGSLRHAVLGPQLEFTVRERIERWFRRNPGVLERMSNGA